jgi:uncharacterized protein YozE (UPF0346 family)
MEFIPSDAYIIMGHGEEPQVTLEEERNFIPSNDKIKATRQYETIGTRSNNGFIDLDSFFIVPNNCIIVVRAKPGELTHLSVINPLLNKIGSVENQELYRNPLSNTKELVNQLGTVSIYKPGDKCPNFKYSLFFSRRNIQPKKHIVSSHLGLLKTPLVSTISLREYNQNNNIITTINEIYNESVFPKKETVYNVILRNILKREPTITETTTYKNMMTTDNSDSGEFINFLTYFFSVTQKQLLKIGDDGIAKRPGVYYNFICRYVDTPYYNRFAYNHMDKVNPNITSILRQPKSTQNLFRRSLNETLRKRKPLIRNLYTGGKRTRKNRRK